MAGPYAVASDGTLIRDLKDVARLLRIGRLVRHYLGSASGLERGQRLALAEGLASRGGADRALHHLRLAVWVRLLAGRAFLAGELLREVFP